MPTMSVRSTEYVHVDITSTDDLSQAVHGMAFPVRGVPPVAGDLLTAEYVAVGPNGGPAIRVLVGPDGGAVALPAGTYDVLARVVDAPETEYEARGTLTVTP